MLFEKTHSTFVTMLPSFLGERISCLFNPYYWNHILFKISIFFDLNLNDPFFLVKIQYFSYPNVKCCSRVRMHFHVGLKTMLQDLDIMFSYSVVTWSHNVLCIQKNDSVWFFISVLQKVDFSAVEFGSRIIMTHFSKSFRSEIDIESADYIHYIFLRLDW